LSFGFRDVPPAASAAPRHLTFHPRGNRAYVINELDSTITALDSDPNRGILKALQTMPTIPTESSVEYLTAEIIIHPSGSFLCGSNHGHDSIVMLAIDQKTGRLTLHSRHHVGGRNNRLTSLLAN
jgi:6-phosphogluconolactonase